MATVGVPWAVLGRLYAIWRLAGVKGRPLEALANGLTNKALELPACTAMRARQLAYPAEAAVHAGAYETFAVAAGEMMAGVDGELAKADIVLVKASSRSIQKTQKLRIRYLNANIVVYFLDKTAL